jgi:hypothetical protein
MKGSIGVPTGETEMKSCLFFSPLTILAAGVIFLACSDDSDNPAKVITPAGQTAIVFSQYGYT